MVTARTINDKKNIYIKKILMGPKLDKTCKSALLWVNVHYMLVLSMIITVRCHVTCPRLSHLEWQAGAKAFPE